MQAAHLVWFRQLKSEPLGIVIDGLNTFELERDEALLTTGESRFWRSLRNILACVVIVPSTSYKRGNSDIKQCV
jgi:hypothetical protein